MLAALRLLLVAQSPFPLPFERDVLVTDAGALLLMRPLHVAGPEVRQLSWSPSGKLLAVLEVDEAKNLENFLPSSAQSKLAPESTVRVWNSETRKSQEIFKKRGVTFEPFTWMGGNVLFSLSAEELPSGPNRPQPLIRTSLLRWGSGQASLTPILAQDTEQGSAGRMTVHTSRKLPIGLAQWRVGSAIEGHVIFPSGSPRSLDIPGSKERNPRGWVHEDASGHLVFEQFIVRTPGPGLDSKFFRLEDSLQWAQIPTFKTYSDEGLLARGADRHPEFSTSVTAFGAAQVRLVNGWLTGRYKNKPSAALVAADSERVELSPDGKYAMYQSQGNLFARPIRHISPEEYEKMLEAAEKMELMSRAKQIGTAAQIYASDNKDHFPPKSSFSDSIMPYLRSAEMMQGFVYEMDGNDISAIPNPAEAVMGYIQGKNGRAVVYADSHVKWIPDKKP